VTERILVLSVLTGVLAILLLLLGLRLLDLARRTREVPELLVGLFFVTLGPSAWLFLMGQASAAPTPPELRMAAVGACGVFLSITFILIFNYRTFRSGVRWAKASVVAACAALLVGLYFEVNGASFQISLEPHFSFMLPRFAVMTWTVYEALRCHHMMRRRLRFGLIDPVVANRFLLYAVWTGVIAILPTIKTAVRLLALAHVEAQWHLPYRIVALLSGAAMLIAMFLNFYPPQAYQRWLRRGQPEGTS
jgi:hypothetical protein